MSADLDRETLEAAIDGDKDAEIARLRVALRRRPTAKTIADAEVGHVVVWRMYEEAARLLREAHVHIEELRDAWERGVISEHDSSGGRRSNLNAELAHKIQKWLKGGTLP